MSGFQNQGEGRSRVLPFACRWCRQYNPDVERLPSKGDIVVPNSRAPKGLAGRRFTVLRVERVECDPWESCAFRNEDRAKGFYVVITTTGERLELDWLDIAEGDKGPA